MSKVLCFDCGSIFTVAEGIKQPTKYCPTCKDKLEDELIKNMFGLE